MPVTITMPALSPTMESGNLAKWLVKEGDEVSSGDVIAEIETDKATMEVEAVDEGVVGKILVEAGTADVAVNAPIALLLEEGEDASALDGAAAAAPAPAAKEAAPAAEAAAPAAAAAPAGPAPVAADGSRIFSSPLARRLAKLNNLDLAKDFRHRPPWPDRQAGCGCGSGCWHGLGLCCCSGACRRRSCGCSGTSCCAHSAKRRCHQGALSGRHLRGSAAFWHAQGDRPAFAGIQTDRSAFLS